MSLAYNQTGTNKRGIIQAIEGYLGFQDADISGNAANLAYFTRLVNSGMDEVLSLIIPASGTWQYDDSNQTDYPIITTNLVASQRDYSFTTDGSSNLILDIYRVFVKVSTTGVYNEIYPFDSQSDYGSEGFTDGQNLTGVPWRYDKTANGIFLDPIPATSITSGLKMYINRESTYFATSDTTKFPGFVGLFHDYLALYAAYDHAFINGLSQANSIRDKMLRMKQEMIEHYSKRERDLLDIANNEPIAFL